jgi:DNA-binding CsgD family transcriptional regulator
MLAISPLTVRKQRRNIFSILKLNSVAQLAGQAAGLDGSK